MIDYANENGMFARFHPSNGRSNVVPGYQIGQALRLAEKREQEKKKECFWKRLFNKK
jgi:hypothetical protein